MSISRDLCYRYFVPKNLHMHVTNQTICFTFNTHSQNKIPEKDLKFPLIITQ